MFNDIEALELFQKGTLGQEILASVEESGFLGLSYWHNGMKQIATTQELDQKDPAGIAGMKCRTQPSDVLKAQFEALGAIPINISFDSVCDALKTGVVSCQENTWSNLEQKLCDVPQYIYETNHGVLGYLVTTSANFWNSLPPEMRFELESILGEVTNKVNDEAQSINNDARERLRKKENTEVKVNPLTSKERFKWRSITQQVWEQFKHVDPIITPPSAVLESRTVLIPAMQIHGFSSIFGIQDNIFELKLQIEKTDFPMELVIIEKANGVASTFPPLAEFFFETGVLDIPLLQVEGVGDFHIVMKAKPDTNPLRFSIDLIDVIPY